MAIWGTGVNSDSYIYRACRVLMSFSFWLLLYKAQTLLTSKHSTEWRCRVVTLVHGISISVAAIYSQLIEGPNIFNTPPGEPNSDTQMTLIVICFGYFLFDIWWCLYYQTEQRRQLPILMAPFYQISSISSSYAVFQAMRAGFVFSPVIGGIFISAAIMLVHHMLSLFGIINSTYACKWGTELVAVLACAEITNPLLQARWFLRQSAYSKHYITAIVDWMFILLFVIFRIALGAAMLFVYYTHPKPDFLGRLGAISIFLLNVVFMFYIGRYTLRKYFFSQFQSESTQTGFSQTSNGVSQHNGSVVTTVTEAVVHDSNGHIKSY